MKTYKIHRNVHIEEGATIGDFVTIGVPPKGASDGELETIIGKGAVIRSNTVIYAGNKIGEDFQTGHMTVIRESNVIGDNVSIGMNVVVEHHNEIGDNVRIQGQAGIAEYSTLEADCWIGPRVLTTNVLHPKCPKAKQCIKGPTIKKGAIIGASVTLVPNITVGEYSFISAGSVVVKDVPPHKVMFGNPARAVKDIYSLTCPFNLIEKPYIEGIQ